jgi:hypothetical protein
VDYKLESIRSAQESAKQILTLCSAILTFVFGAVAVGSLELNGAAIFAAALVVFSLLLSILGGIVALFSLSGILSSAAEMSAEVPLASRNYRWFGRLQFFSFAASILIMSVLIMYWPEKKAGSKIEISLPPQFVCSFQQEKLGCSNSKN